MSDNIGIRLDNEKKFNKCGDEVAQFIDTLLQRYEPLTVASYLTIAGMTIYNSLLGEQGFAQLIDFIKENKTTLSSTENFPTIGGVQ